MTFVVLWLCSEQVGSCLNNFKEMKQLPIMVAGPSLAPGPPTMESISSTLPTTTNQTKVLADDTAEDAVVASMLIGYCHVILADQ